MFASEEEQKRLSNLCRKFVELIDDLPWIDPNTLLAKKHERADWAKQLLKSMPFPHLGIAPWLVDLEAYLSKSNVSVECQLFQQKHIWPEREFDEEEKRWLRKVQREIDESEQMPNLRELTMQHIDKRFSGNKTQARQAAFVDRRTFSSMMQMRPASAKQRGALKRTLIQLACAFELTLEELKEYLASAGLSLKPYGEDMVYLVCFRNEIYDFDMINEVLKGNGFDELVDPDAKMNPKKITRLR